jgi:hypothetical protein
MIQRFSTLVQIAGFFQLRWSQAGDFLELGGQMSHTTVTHLHGNLAKVQLIVQ